MTQKWTIEIQKLRFQAYKRSKQSPKKLINLLSGLWNSEGSQGQRVMAK